MSKKKSAAKKTNIPVTRRALEVYDGLAGLTEVIVGEKNFTSDPDYLEFRRVVKDKSLLFQNMLDVDVDETKERFARLAAEHKTSIYTIFLIKDNANNLSLLLPVKKLGDQIILDLVSFNGLVSSVKTLIVELTIAKRNLYLQAMLSEAYNNLIAVGVDPSLILVSSDVIPFVNGQRLKGLIDSLDVEGWQRFKVHAETVSVRALESNESISCSEIIEAIIRGDRAAGEDDMNIAKLQRLELFNNSQYNHVIRYALFNAVIYEQAAIVADCLKKYVLYFTGSHDAKQLNMHKDHVKAVENIAWQAIIRGNDEIAKQFLQPEMWATYTEGYKVRTAGVIALYNPSLLLELIKHNFLTPELVSAAVDFELDNANKIAISDAVEKSKVPVMRKGLPLTDFYLSAGMVHLTPADQSITPNNLTDRFFSTIDDYNRAKGQVEREASEHNLVLLKGLAGDLRMNVTEKAEEGNLENWEKTNADLLEHAQMRALQSGIVNEFKFRPYEGVEPLEIMLTKRLLISNYFNQDHVLQMEPAPVILSIIAGMINSNLLEQMIGKMRKTGNKFLEELLRDTSKDYSDDDRLPYVNVIKNIFYNEEEQSLKLLKAKRSPYRRLEEDALIFAARYGRSKIVSFCLDKHVEAMELSIGDYKNSSDLDLIQATEAVIERVVHKLHRLVIEVIARGNIDTCKAFFRPHVWNIFNQQQQAEIVNMIVIRSGLNTMSVLINDLMSNNFITPELIKQASTLALSDLEEKYISDYLEPFSISLGIISKIKQSTETIENILADTVIPPQTKEAKYAIFAELAYLYGQKNLQANHNFVAKNYNQLKILLPNANEMKEFQNHFADKEISRPAAILSSLIMGQDLVRSNQSSKAKKTEQQPERSIKIRAIEDILAASGENVNDRFAEISLACKKLDLDKFVKKNIEILREMLPSNKEEFETIFSKNPAVITASRKLMDLIVKKSRDASKPMVTKVAMEKAQYSPLERNIQALLSGDTSILQPIAWKSNSHDNQYKIFKAIVSHPDQNSKQALLECLRREALLTSSLVNRANNDGDQLDDLYNSIMNVERIKNAGREPKEILSNTRDKAACFAELAYAMNHQSDSASRKFITPKIQSFKELLPQNIQEFEQRFLDKEIIEGAKKLIRNIAEVYKEVSLQLQAKEKSQIVSKHQEKPKEMSKAPITTTKPEKVYKAVEEVNLANIGKASIKPKPEVEQVAQVLENVTIAANIVDIKEAVPSNITKDNESKEEEEAQVLENVTIAENIVTYDENMNDDGRPDNYSYNAPMRVQQEQLIFPQPINQPFISREEIMQEINYLSNMESSVHFNIQNRLAFLSNLLNPLPPVALPPQNQISYYNQHGHLIIGNIRPTDLGPVALTQNTYTGEIMQQPLEIGRWTSQVAVQANINNTAQISKPGAPNSFVEAEEIRRNSQSMSQKL